MKYIQTIILILCYTIAFSQSKQKDETMLVDGLKRKFTSYVPAIKDKSRKMPLVISIHGGLASPKGQFHLADFRPLADTDQFMVICPGSHRVFHDEKEDANSESFVDDVKFIDQIITYAIDTYNADPQRLYVTGISNGGFLTSRVACELSKRIAAIAVVAATMDSNEGYAPVRPMPVIYIHGSKDPVFSGKGGNFFGKKFYSFDNVLKVWATLDGCDLKPAITRIPDLAKDSTSIVKEEYTNPKNGLKVIGYNIIGGGHTWPGGWQYLPKFIVGKTSKNLNACKEIWTFFKQYSLN